MRYIAHLIGIPLLLLVVAFVALSGSSLLLQTHEWSGAAIYLRRIGFALGTAAIIVQICNCWRVWRAYRGLGDVCEYCTTPATRKNGRHGPYLKCWRCGHNHAIDLTIGQ